jgi:hypothetical protein
VPSQNSQIGKKATYAVVICPDSIDKFNVQHTYKVKDRVTRTPLKTGRVISSCSTSGTRRVNLVTNPVISHEWGKDREVFTTGATSGAGTDYPPGFQWGSCYSIFNFICMFCISLFVLLFLFSPFYLNLPKMDFLYVFVWKQSYIEMNQGYFYFLPQGRYLQLTHKICFSNFIILLNY